jgi:riboflavin synthase
MFTGIVTDMGEVRSVKPSADNLSRIAIACSYSRATLIEGASMACSGVCLTIVEAGQGDKGDKADGRAWFAVDAAAETLRLTTAGRWRPGSKVNLERPLKLGDELGGHMVAGHVDGLATVVAREDMTDNPSVDMAGFVLRAPAALARFIAPKGSVALDGVSLTVNAVEGDTFSVLIIPHTLKVTTLGGLKKGDDANLEIDTMARYAARLMEQK